MHTMPSTALDRSRRLANFGPTLQLQFGSYGVVVAFAFIALCFLPCLKAKVAEVLVLNFLESSNNGRAKYLVDAA